MIDDDVARAISHDLRGPTRRIGALLHLLNEKAGGLPEPAAEYLDMALAEVITLQDHLDALQEFIRVDRHAKPAEPVGLDELVAASRPLVDGRLEVTEPLPTVSIDIRHARRIVEALVENAATHAGPTAHLTVMATTVDGGTEVHFRDDGAGVDPALGDRIFQLFRPTRGPDGRTKLTSGLAIARRMARYHGGELSIGPDKGGHFIWHIPKGDKP